MSSSSSSSSSGERKPEPPESELSEQDLGKLAGGLKRNTSFASDSCKETSDTGIMGCPS